MNCIWQRDTETDMYRTSKILIASLVCAYFVVLHARGLCSLVSIRQAKGAMSPSHTHPSLVTRLHNLLNTHEKRGGAWDPMSHDKHWHNIVKERDSTTVDFESFRQTSVYQTTAL